MSLSDTIDAIIKESSSVERELRWFLSALPAIVSTEHGYQMLIRYAKNDVRGRTREPSLEAVPENRLRCQASAQGS